MPPYCLFPYGTLAVGIFDVGRGRFSLVVEGETILSFVYISSMIFPYAACVCVGCEGTNESSGVLPGEYG